MATRGQAQLPIVLERLTRAPKRIYLVGSGSSVTASWAALPLFEELTGADVRVVSSLEFVHYLPASRLDSTTLVIAVSQAGRSIWTIKAMERAKKYGAFTLLVTSDLQSAAAEVADAALDILIGKEGAPAKTKGYTATVATLYALAGALGGQPVDLSPLSDLATTAIKATAAGIADWIKLFRGAPSVTVLSYGPGMGVAMEGGLKILETVQVPVEVYDVEEYMHGPQCALNENSRLIFLAPPGPGEPRAVTLAEIARRTTKYTATVCSEGSPLVSLTGHGVELPGVADPRVAPVAYVIPLQYLASEWTKANGREPEDILIHFGAALGTKLPPR